MIFLTFHMAIHHHVEFQKAFYLLRRSGGSRHITMHISPALLWSGSFTRLELQSMLSLHDKLFLNQLISIILGWWAFPKSCIFGCGGGGWSPSTTNRHVLSPWHWQFFGISLYDNHLVDSFTTLKRENLLHFCQLWNARVFFKICSL